MIPIETLATTFATLTLLLAAACAFTAIYTKIKGRKHMPVTNFNVLGVNPYEPADYPTLQSDLPQASHIEITIAEQPDGTTQLWVNVDGANAFRAYKVKNLTIDDRRAWSMEAALKTAE